MYLETGLAAQTTQYAMGTVMTYKAFGPQAAGSLTAVCAEVARIEDLLSRFIPGSDISRVNRSAGIKPEPISPATYQVLSKALDFSRSYPGCLDVTIEPLVDLWHKSKAALTPPDAECIRQVLPLVDDRDVLLDPWEMTAGLRNIGQAIDLGGIGKGFAGNRIQAIFKEYGVASAYANLGGNVVTLGTKPDGAPWRIGIQHPRLEDKIIASVAVAGQSVVTSGDYQRYFTDRQGKRRHHILDPRTGYPAESGLVSVSIISEDALAADALATIVFIAGLEKGLEYLGHIAQTEAVLVDTDLRVTVTPGLRRRFQADQGIEVKYLD